MPKKEAAIKTLQDRTHSHSHIPAANHVQVLDIYANPKDTELQTETLTYYKWGIEDKRKAN